MTREEVYDLCRSEYLYRVLLPKEAVDAIIDCAKEETIERLRNLGWFDND